MDDKFKAFESWYARRKSIWEKRGFLWRTPAYWIKVYSENGLGNIVLYESNGYNWVDFESGNYNLKENDVFCKSGILFDTEDDLFTYEQEFIKHITWQ